VIGESHPQASEYSIYRVPTKPGRIIGCEPSLLGRPLAVNHPCNDDELPLEAAGLDRTTYQPGAHHQQPVSTESASKIGCFRREAESSCLMSRVLDFIKPEKLYLALPKEILGLDTELQAYLSSLVLECAELRRIHGGAIAMCTV
jgi:hypothetical protein